MRLTMSLLVLGALSGCASDAIDRRAAKDVSDVRAMASGAFVGASCRGGTGYGPTCGLLSDFVATEDFRTRFRNKRCLGHNDEDCQLGFQRAFDTWLGHRYASADFKEVARTCDRYPTRCATAQDFELRLLDSHNQHVRDDVIEAEAHLESERQAAQARHRQAQREVLFGTYGEIEYVTLQGPACRTYPALFGGVNTVCDH